MAEIDGRKMPRMKDEDKEAERKRIEEKFGGPVGMGPDGKLDIVGEDEDEDEKDAPPPDNNRRAEKDFYK